MVRLLLSFFCTTVHYVLFGMVRLMEPQAGFDHSTKIILKDQRSWTFAAFGFINGVNSTQKKSFENSM